LKVWTKFPLYQTCQLCGSVNKILLSWTKQL
jgi:hypothetical protein